MNLDVLRFFEESILVTDLSGVIVYFNPSAEKMFDYSAEEMVGKPMDILLPTKVRHLHPAHVASFLASDDQYRRMNERTVVAGRRRDGSLIEVEATISKVSSGEDRYLMAVLRDVSERVAWETKIRVSEQRHRALLNACPDAILLADAVTARITDANDEAARLFACKPEDLIGLHQGELHPDADRERFERTFREHIDIGRIMVPDARIQTFDGRVVPVEIAAKPTVVGNEAVVVGFFRDITLRKERERQLSDALKAAESANHAKEMFLANVSHELRTPLNAIIGFSDLIRNEYFGAIGNPVYVEYANDISDSGHHLLDIISDILEVSRIELGRVQVRDETVDLNQIFSQCARMVSQLAAENAVTLIQEQREPLLVQADAKLVRQMVLNLLYNAIKFTPELGHVSYGAEKVADGVALWVSDTGVGIPEDQVDMVLKPFATVESQKLVSKSGVGLGLSITRGLIEAHGGTIRIERSESGGARITLKIPPNRVL